METNNSEPSKWTTHLGRASMKMVEAAMEAQSALGAAGDHAGLHDVRRISMPSAADEVIHVYLVQQVAITHTHHPHVYNTCQSARVIGNIIAYNSNRQKLDDETYRTVQHVCCCMMPGHTYFSSLSDGQ